MPNSNPTQNIDLNAEFARALPIVTRYLYRYVGSEAEDVASDACIKALKNLDKYDGRAKFSTWPVTRHLTQSVSTSLFTPTTRCSSKTTVEATKSTTLPTTPSFTLLLPACLKSIRKLFNFIISKGSSTVKLLNALVSPSVRLCPVLVRQNSSCKPTIA